MAVSRLCLDSSQTTRCSRLFVVILVEQSKAKQQPRNFFFPLHEWRGTCRIPPMGHGVNFRRLHRCFGQIEPSARWWYRDSVADTKHSFGKA